MIKRTTSNYTAEGTLRVNNLRRMSCFYEKVLGLAVAGEFPNAVLLEICEPGGRHAQAIGLVKRAASAGADSRELGSVTLVIRADDYDAERKRLENLGLKVEVKSQPRVRTRALYIHDPEGNEVELVCAAGSPGKRN